jgi:hypothetical protein
MLTRPAGAASLLLRFLYKGFSLPQQLLAAWNGKLSLTGRPTFTPSSDTSEEVDMKKFVFLLLALVMTWGQFEAIAYPAEAIHPVAGVPVFSADGHRLGVIYKVLPDGSVKLIVDGKMVAIAAERLQEAHGAIVTSLTRSEVHELRRGEGPG